MKHPSSFIRPDLIQAIKALAPEAERLGKLHPEQLRIIYEQRWFNLFVPKAYGGLELSLPEGLEIEEALAWADGSLGWTVTLCSGANWFVGFLESGAAKELFGDPHVCLAGSGRASGVATVTPEGYAISGDWQYATGAPYATAFTANCRIEKEGTWLKDEAGNPMVKAFWFKKEEVQIREDWNTIGMCATASHSFEVKQVQVPHNRCFTIDSQHTFLQQPVYQYPFLQLAEATLAVNHSGMALSFLDESTALLIEKEKTGSLDGKTAKGICKKAEAARERLDAARKSLYMLVDQSWQELLDKQGIAPELLNEVSLASHSLAVTARQEVDSLYPYCGLTAAHPQTALNRIWRDLHTASQHPLLLPVEE